MKSALSCAVVLAFAATASAADVPWCSADTVDRFQYLRRLSLDLRQRAPGLAEYESLVGQAEIDPATVDAYLASDDFRETVRAYHRELLWPNLEQALIFAAVAQLAPMGGPDGRLFIAMDERTVVYRGAGGAPCANREQTEFEADGTPLPGADGLDGWVMVEPYWAPGTSVKVCAYDAQPKLETDDVVGGNAVHLPCYATGGYVSRRCGCGPNLAYCNFGPTRGLIRDSFVEQLLRLIDAVVIEDRPYSQVLTTREAELNGPISHYLRWQWGFAYDQYMEPDGAWSFPQTPYAPPLAFTSRESWVKVERGPTHAGILTLPGYLMKFQTNRSRAHRFHNAFLCQPFQPPPGGLRLEPSSEADVARRPGCSYCHQTLEPAAAYWGRFVEQGTTYLDPQLFPTQSELCRRRAWGSDPLLRARCMRAYISDHEPKGVLRAFEFARDGSPEAEQLRRHADEGPRSFAEVALADGRFASCTARRWWKQLLRRDPTAEEERGELSALAADFRRNHYCFKSLIRAIVTSESYRRAP